MTYCRLGSIVRSTFGYLAENVYITASCSLVVDARSFFALPFAASSSGQTIGTLLAGTKRKAEKQNTANGLLKKARYVLHFRWCLFIKSPP